MQASVLCRKSGVKYRHRSATLLPRPHSPPLATQTQVAVLIMTLLLIMVGATRTPVMTLQ